MSTNQLDEGKDAFLSVMSNERAYEEIVSLCERIDNLKSKLADFKAVAEDLVRWCDEGLATQLNIADIKAAAIEALAWDASV